MDIWKLRSWMEVVGLSSRGFDRFSLIASTGKREGGAIATVSTSSFISGGKQALAIWKSGTSVSNIQLLRPPPLPPLPPVSCAAAASLVPFSS